MRVHDIGVARCSPSGMRVGGEKEWQEQHLPRTPLEVPDDPVPVREPEVPERGWRDHVDGKAGRPQVLYRIAYERPRDVVRPARVRRRENDDLHSRRARATTGSAAASVANT